MIHIRKVLLPTSAILISLLIAGLFLLHPDGKDSYAAGKVIVYFFWSAGCLHCEKEEAFLSKLGRKYPELDIRSFEVKNNPESARFFSTLADAYGIKIKGVPTTFIGGMEPIIGYAADESTGRDIEKMVIKCIADTCFDPLEKLRRNLETPLLYPNSGITGQQDVCPQGSECPEETTPHPGGLEGREDGAGVQQMTEPATRKDTTVELPLIGELKISDSLLYQTIMIAGVDGFNPCAFFVLFTLLGILLHVQSRKKVFLVGGIFVFFSGFIYFIFMAAWLNIFLLAGRLAAVTTAAGAIALSVALINIKDFFYYRKGVSLVIPEKAKPRLYERMRKLLKATSLPSVILGTVVLAAAANMYELFCTAGFPMAYTRILTLRNLPKMHYYFYLVLYNVIYIIPLALIVLFFAVTLGAKKLTELQGQMLKLVSGMMMLSLGAVLLVKPELMNNAVMSVGLLGMSLITSGVIVAAARRLKTER